MGLKQAHLVPSGPILTTRVARDLSEHTRLQLAQLPQNHTKTMVSFRFPFSFSQPPRPPVSATVDLSSRPFSATTAALSVAAAALSVAGAGIAISRNADNPFLQKALNFLASNGGSFCPMWGSLSLSENSSAVTESRTGTSFPAVLGDSQRLLGVGLRRKAVLGLKNIDVYAFGTHTLTFNFHFEELRYIDDNLLGLDVTRVVR